MQINYKCQDSLEKSIKSLTFFKKMHGISENYGSIHGTLSKSERQEGIRKTWKVLWIDEYREHFTSLTRTLQNNDVRWYKSGFGVFGQSHIQAFNFNTRLKNICYFTRILNLCFRLIGH